MQKIWAPKLLAVGPPVDVGRKLWSLSRVATKLRPVQNQACRSYRCCVTVSQATGAPSEGTVGSVLCQSVLAVLKKGSWALCPRQRRQSREEKIAQWLGKWCPRIH